MSRETPISSRFRDLRESKKAGLLPFLTVGDPNLRFTEKAIRAMDRPGVIAIELGVPFSDPLADGPTIQLSSERALANGVSLRDTLNLVERVRPKISTPLVLMSYLNPIHRFGYDKFARRAASAGVDAVLPTDMPIEESASLRGSLKKHEVGVVFLAAPTTPVARIRKIAGLSTAFTYYVSLTGTTGARATLPAGLVDRLKKVRAVVQGPLAVGFGVSKGSHVRRLAPHCDAVVVGSAVVRTIDGEKNDSARLAALDRLLRDLIRPLRPGKG